MGCVSRWVVCCGRRLELGDFVCGWLHWGRWVVLRLGMQGLEGQRIWVPSPRVVRMPNLGQEATSVHARIELTTDVLQGYLRQL